MKVFEALDTPQGHILVCFALILIGIGMASLRIVKAEEVIFGSFTALLAFMRAGAASK